MTDTPQPLQSPPGTDAHDDWINRCVTAAQLAAPVNQNVVKVISDQLAGNASVRPLKPVETTALAKSLLAAQRSNPIEEPKS